MDEREQQFAQEHGALMARTGYAMQAGNDINTLLSELTNPENDIYEVELSLKGMQLNQQGKPERISEPLLNDEGVANMIRLMRTMVSRVMFMSNLEEDQIRVMTYELGYNIDVDLITHKKEYNIDESIKGKSDMTTIRSIVTYKAFEAGMSALENGFRRFLKSGIIETTVTTGGTQPLKSGKGGGLGSILGFGRK